MSDQTSYQPEIREVSKFAGLKHTVRSEGGARGQKEKDGEEKVSMGVPIPFPYAGGWQRTT